MRLSNRQRRRQKRRMPQLNTTATADISFMLLIFFLVTTSMDSDKGLRRQLPPHTDRTEVKAVDVDRKKVLTIAITDANNITINDTIVDDDVLRQRIAQHVRTVGEDHIIELQASRTANYDTYFHLQNVIVHTYRTDLKGQYTQRISEQFQ